MSTSMGSKPVQAFLAGSRLAKDKLNSEEYGLNLQQILDKSEGDPKVLSQHLFKIGKSDPQSPYLLDAYLDALPSDSLYLPSTIAMINMITSAPIARTGKALGVLIADVRKHPIYSGNMMSSWFTLTSLFTQTVDTAAAQGNFALLEDMLDLQDTLYQEQEMTDHFKAYYTTRYYAQADNYPEFVKNFESFLKEQYLEAKWARIIEVDHAHFLNGLESNHGTSDPQRIEKEKYEQAKMIHFSLFRLSFAHLQALTRVFAEQYPKDFENYDKSQMIQSMEMATEMYKKNPVSISPNFVTLNEKYIARYTVL